MGRGQQIGFNSCDVRTRTDKSKYLNNSYNGSIVVVDRSQQQNTYFTGFNHGNSARPFGGDDFEIQLIHKLKAQYGQDLINIPNGARVIFTAFYSPCTNCTRAFDNLARLISAQNRDITIKVRFEYHYVESRFDKGKGRWKSRDNADRAYERMAIEFDDMLTIRQIDRDTISAMINS